MKKGWIACFISAVLLVSCCGCSQILEKAGAGAAMEEAVEESADAAVEEAADLPEETCKTLLINTWENDAAQTEYLLSEDGTYLEVTMDELYTGTWFLETEEDGISYFHLQTSDDPENDYTYRYQFSVDQDVITFFDRETGAQAMQWTLVTGMDEGLKEENETITNHDNDAGVTDVKSTITEK